MRKSFCLKSVYSSKQINQSPHNTSTSKNLYSFPKQSRFKQQAAACDKIYNLPSLQPRKYGVGIGRGTKSDFTKDLTASPGSSKYFNRSEFEESVAKRKGYSMAQGREKSPHQGYLDLSQRRVPGPGTYQSEKGEMGLRYTMRRKTKVLDRSMTLDAQNDNPGPGNYENPQAFSPNGRYQVSKHLGTGAPTLSRKNSEKRFFQFKNQVPGPGDYMLPPTISGTSRYVNSKNISTGLRAFTISKRMSKFDQITQSKKNIPGPGSYRQPSDFGQYDGDIYGKGSTNRA